MHHHSYISYLSTVTKIPQSHALSSSVDHTTIQASGVSTSAMTLRRAGFTRFCTLMMSTQSQSAWLRLPLVITFLTHKNASTYIVVFIHHVNTHILAYLVPCCAGSTLRGMLHTQPRLLKSWTRGRASSSSTTTQMHHCKYVVLMSPYL